MHLLSSRVYTKKSVETSSGRGSVTSSSWLHSSDLRNSNGKRLRDFDSHSSHESMIHGGSSSYEEHVVAIYIVLRE